MILSVQLTKECSKSCKNCYLKSNVVEDNQEMVVRNTIDCINIFPITSLYIFYNPTIRRTTANAQYLGAKAMLKYCNNKNLASYIVINSDIEAYTDEDIKLIGSFDNICISTSVHFMDQNLAKIRSYLNTEKEISYTGMCPIDWDYKKLESNSGEYNKIQLIWMKPMFDGELIATVVRFVNDISFGNPALRSKILLDTCLLHIAYGRSGPCNNQLYIHNDGFVNRCPYICTVLGRESGTTCVEKCPMKLIRETGEKQ